MKQKRNKDGSEEPGASPPVPAQSLVSGSEKTLPHPSGGTIQTEGGSYIDGPVTNLGGLNVFGGRIEKVHLDYHGPMLPPVIVPTRPTSYLPFFRNTLFQPRPGEFEHLESLLRPDEARRLVRVRLIGVTGMGGIGKTQLTVEFAYRYQDRFPGGTFWMPAIGHTSSDLQRNLQRQFAELARNADYLPADDDMSNPENELQRARHFCRYLVGQADALLILDNVEDPYLVLSILPGFAGKEPACAILYTSRSTLTPPGITLHSVELLPEDAALRFLLETTRPELLAEVVAGNQDAEANAARFICHETGYLPLALKHLRGLLVRDQRITLVRLAGVLKQRGALDLAKTQQGDATPLFATFTLSWERIQQKSAQRLFKLVAYFPEATPIPLWLIGLAAGLGESGGSFEPLGEALLLLKEESLLEELSDEQIRVHPLLREFGQWLVTEDGDSGKNLLEEAGKRLISECTDLNRLENRSQQEGYWRCLEQVRAAHQYIELLGMTSQAQQVEPIERWLNRESSLLGDQVLSPFGAPPPKWLRALPGLFFQQLFNQSVEEGHTVVARISPRIWLRLTQPVGAKDQPLLQVLVGHTSLVWDVAFSPDSALVLTGSSDNTARLWETASGKLLRIFSHPDGVLGVAFSPDSALVLTGSGNTARLWETASGKLLRIFSHPAGVLGVAFSPDSTQIVTGSMDEIVRLWELASGTLLRTFDGPFEGISAQVRRLEFSPDGTRILASSHDTTGQIWELASGTLLRTFKISVARECCAVFSPDNTKLLIGRGRTAFLVEPLSGKTLQRLEGHKDLIMSVVFSSNGQKMLTGSWDNTACVWKVESGETLGTVESVAFSPDGTKVLTGSADNTARLWETASGVVLQTFEDRMKGGEGKLGGVRSAAFSPDGTKALTGSSNNMARLWETASGAVLQTLEDYPRGIRSIPSSDGLRGVRSVAFSPDGTKVLTGSADNTARLWETASGALLQTFEGHTNHVRSVAFSPDGTKVLTGSADNTARLWETASGTVLQTFEGHTKSVLCAAFSPDGAKLLTGSDHSDEGMVRIWEVASGKQLQKLEGHRSWITYVGFSLDGRLMLTCDHIGWVLLWQASEPYKAHPLGFYVASYEIGAAYWPDTAHLVLADIGGRQGKSHFYRLKLEGVW